MNYRQMQTERGEYAVKKLAKFLEKKFGVLTVSIHEENYSSGQNGIPDLIFKDNAVEVKRIEFIRLDKQLNNPCNKLRTTYTYLGNLKINSEAWDREKKWAIENKKKLIVIAVLTLKSREPIFIKLFKNQINELQLKQNKKWICLSVWKLLQIGEILNVQ